MSQEIKNQSREYNVREHFVRKTIIYVEGITDKEYFKYIQLFNWQTTEIRIPNEDIKNNKIDVEKQIFFLKDPTHAIGIVDKDIDQKKKYESLFYTDYYDLEMTIFWFANKVDLINNILNFCREKINPISRIDFDKITYRSFILASLMGRIRMWLKSENYRANIDRIPNEVKLNLPKNLSKQIEIPYFEIFKSSGLFFEMMFKHQLFNGDFKSELNHFLKNYFKILGFQYWHLMDKQIKDYFSKFSENFDNIADFLKNEVVFHYCNTHIFVEILVNSLIEFTQSKITKDLASEIRYNIERKIRFSLNKNEFMLSNLYKSIRNWEEKYDKKLIFNY